MHSDELEKAEAYFISTKGFARLIKAMAQKYQSLGRWGGSVTLLSPKEEEREALAAFFRADFSRQKSITISLERFAKALELTKFSSVSPISLLEKIHGESLISNSERIAAKERLKTKFFEDLLLRCSQPYCQRWLRAIIEKEPGTRPVHTAFETHLDLLRVQVGHVLEALSALNQQPPGKIERLPVFARRITKDPHGFDANSDTGRLLIQALRILDNKAHDLEPLTPALTGTEELTELYYSFGLLRDDLWNFVTCTGITASARDNGNKPLSYLTEAYLQQVTLNLPLREVVRIGNAYPGLLTKENCPTNVSCARYNSCSGVHPNKSAKAVFVVENSGVFSALLDRFREFCEEEGCVEWPNPPLICTHGQFKLASLLLLDKFAADGTEIYYSGDFDPEGLLMMERLLRRYPSQAKPWHYTVADYQLAYSNQTISLQRLKQLDRVVSSQLGPLKEEILKTERAGYQEGIINELWREVINFNVRLIPNINLDKIKTVGKH